MGKHSKVRNSARQMVPRQMVPRGIVEMVDVQTGDNHLLTLEAASAGQRAPNRYLTLCGVEIIPAALVDLTCQHKNQILLVEGPEITVRPVGTRRVTSGPR